MLKMIALSCVCALAALPALSQNRDDTQAQALPAQQCVILLHGLARTKASMLTLQEMLQDHHFQVVNHGYRSRTNTILKLALGAIPEARAACAEDETPAVVTHSMGAILLRAYAEAHPDQKWGPVVMLGPPNHGSGIIDAHGGKALFQWLNGPAALELKTDGLPDQLPPVPFVTGVIAGSQSLNPATSALVDGADDGKVSIESTKVAGMKDHITLPVTHTFMMHNPKVMAQTLLFLKTQRFAKDMTTRNAFAVLSADP